MGRRPARPSVKAACALVAAAAVADVIGALRSCHALATSAAQDPTRLWADLLATAACATLMVLACVRGLRLGASEAPDTRDEVNACQVVGICAGGLALVDWIVDGMVSGAGGLPFALGCMALGAYFRAVRGLRRSVSWADEPGDGGTALPGPDTAHAEFAVDAASGFLRPARDGEELGLAIREPNAFVNGLPGHVAEQVARTIAHPSHCSCSAIGATVFGNVHVPAEGLRAALGAAGEDASLSYRLHGGTLTLAMGEGPARRLVDACLADQYLPKADPAVVLVELFGLLIAEAPTWMDAQEERLVRLEDSLNDDVRELPRDFTEFANDTRRELGRLAGFYKQAGEMFEDLAKTPAGTSCGAETRQMMASLSNRLLRLSADAAALREHVAEMRMGYQERIDVRQNSVISLLTVVTTVFTPLSLVTGWYGMNFANMPELAHPDAYFVMIAALVAVVTAEVAFFKHRRWF